MPKRGVSKESVGITIDKEILKKLDAFCKANHNAKRSVIIEEAVKNYLEGKAK